MERYFDAHLYFANWGTHRLMLRIPKARVDLKALKPYFVGRHAARLTSTGEHVLLDLGSDTEEPEYDEQSQGSLAALSPLRAELMRGDLRPAYLAWLLAVAADDLDDDAEEPPVPAGLAELTAAQEAMVEFLRIDVDLVSAAASGSAAVTEDRAPFRRWLAALPAKEKEAWLTRAADDPDLGSEVSCFERSGRQRGVRTSAHGAPSASCAHWPRPSARNGRRPSRCVRRRPRLPPMRPDSGTWRSLLVMSKALGRSSRSSSKPATTT
jgi:hypothetical protein